ncbi:MAG: DUF2911 domain-containing protein [Flammeovirgaceae bacterium]
MRRITYLLTPLLLMVFLLACNTNSNTGNKGINTGVEEKPVKASPYEKATAKIKDTKITINYSSPRTKGRKIWGGLVPYDEVWRTGADEATVFETSTKLMVEGKELLPGKYALFTIPNEEEWTVIFNNVHNQWGAFNYEESKDALRVKVKPMTVEESKENMTFYILETGDGEGEIKLAWEKVKVAIAFKALPKQG